MARSVPADAQSSTRPAQALAYVVYWFLVITLGFSLAGLVLAVVEAFRPLPFLAIGSGTAAVFGAMSWLPFRAAIRALLSGGLLPIVTVALIIGASGVSAAAFSAEHVLTNRDPGVYVTTAKWLAEEGTLLVDGSVGGFGGIEGITAQSLGYYEERTDGLLNPQFMHLLPVWGAVAEWIGGDQALFRVNTVIIMGAVATFWLFSALLLRPWLAVLATAGLAVNLVTVHFARDVYSEPLTLMLVFAALAFLVLAEHSRSYGLSMLTGLLIGATAAARIDAWLVIVGFALYLEVRWYLAERNGDCIAIERLVHPVLLGTMMGGAVSLLDGLFRSAPYLSAHRRQFLAMIGLLLLVIVGGAVARLVGPERRICRWFEGRRQAISWIAPVTIGLLAFVLFFVRPAIPEVRGVNVVAFAIQVENLPLDPSRAFRVWPLRWLSWYLGVGGLAAGIAGLALAWRRAVLGNKLLLPSLLVTSITTAVYLLLPSISPDQIWAMRRFLPVTVPALIFGTALLVDWALCRWHLAAQRWSIGAMAVALVVVMPASFVWPLRTATAYRGMYALTSEVCDALPEDAALLLVSQAHARVFQAAVRSFCAVPVAAIDESTPDPSTAIETARASWAELDVILYVGDLVTGRLGSTAVETQYSIPEVVLTRRPARSIDLGFAIEVAPASASQVSRDG